MVSGKFIPAVARSRATAKVFTFPGRLDTFSPRHDRGASGLLADTLDMIRAKQGSYRLASLLAALLGAASAAPACAAAGTSATFLLVDGGVPDGQQRLSACDHALSDLQGRLTQGGVSSVLLVAPSAAGIRQGLMHFSTIQTGVPHVLLFCGYAAAQDGAAFALGKDGTASDDLALSAVSVRAFSRVLGNGGGIVLLDLYPAVSDPARAGALANTLGVAGTAWVTDDSLPGQRLFEIAATADAAPLSERLARSDATTVDGVLQAVANAPKPDPAPDAAATKAVSVSATTPTPPPPPSPIQPPIPAPTPPPVPREPSSPQTIEPKPMLSPPAAHGSGSAAHEPVRLAPASTPARRPRPAFHKTMQHIQVALLARGLYGGRVTGVDSPATMVAIRHFQAMIGHPVSGQITPDEIKLLTSK